MKKHIVLFSVFIVQFCLAQQSVINDSIIKDIESRIVLPAVPDFHTSVLRFGANPDGVTDCRQAFEKAMKACERRKGGTIVVPKGTYLLNGPIHFVSYVNLHLEKGAKLVFGNNPQDYPVVLTSWEGTMLYNYSPLIYGINLQDVSITGQGVIDGEGHGVWASWKPKEQSGKSLSREMNHNQQPVTARVFGEGYFLRPQLIQFLNSKNILIEGVTLEDSPFWTLHLLKSESITIRGLKYNAHNKNNDGIDIEHSKNVLIEDVDFDNADDNIAIKAGRDDDGRNSNMPSENIIVRNCRFKGLHAMVIGSEMSAGVKNVFVYNSEASGYLKRGVYLKTNSDRGGFINNVYVENIKFKDVEDAIFMTSNYHGEGSGLHPSKISNIHLSKLSFNEASNAAIVIEGYPDFKVENVYLNEIVVKKAKNGITLTNTTNINFNEIVIGDKQGVPSAVK